MPYDSNVTNIGPEGGTASDSQNRVTVVIPPGALTSTIPVQVTPFVQRERAPVSSPRLDGHDVRVRPRAERDDVRRASERHTLELALGSDEHRHSRRLLRRNERRMGAHGERDVERVRFHLHDLALLHPRRQRRSQRPERRPSRLLRRRREPEHVGAGLWGKLHRRVQRLRRAELLPSGLPRPQHSLRRDAQLQQRSRRLTPARLELANEQGFDGGRVDSRQRRRSVIAVRCGLRTARQLGVEWRARCV